MPRLTPSDRNSVFLYIYTKDAYQKANSESHRVSNGLLGKLARKFLKKNNPELRKSIYNWIKRGIYSDWLKKHHPDVPLLIPSTTAKVAHGDEARQIEERVIDPPLANDSEVNHPFAYCPFFDEPLPDIYNFVSDEQRCDEEQPASEPQTDEPSGHRARLDRLDRNSDDDGSEDNSSHVNFTQNWKVKMSDAEFEQWVASVPLARSNEEDEEGPAIGQKSVSQFQLKYGWTEWLYRVMQTMDGFECVPIFGRHRVNKQKEPRFTSSAHCNMPSCRVKFKLSRTSNEDLNVVATGTLLHREGEYSRRPTGPQSRKKQEDDLQKDTPGRVREKLTRGCGHDLTDAPSIAVCKTRNANRKRIVPNVDEIKELEIYAKMTPNVRFHIQNHPFWFTFYTLRQIKELSKLKAPWIFVDATGLLVKRIQDSKTLLYAAVCEKLPFAHMISTKQDTLAIFTFIWNFFGEARHQRQAFRVGHVVCDFSFATLHAAILVFWSSNLQAYVEYCYRVVVGNIEKSLIMTHFHICFAHIIKALSSRIPGKSSKIRTLRKMFLKFVSRLAICHTLKEAEDTYLKIFVVFSTKSWSPRVASSLTATRVVSDEELEFPTTLIEPIELERNKWKTYASGSPFVKHFRSLVHENFPESVHLTATQVDDDDVEEVADDNDDECDTNVDNPYFAPKLLKDLEYFLAFYPMWSVIMDPDRQRPITNATVESHFKYLKHGVMPHQRQQRPLYVAKNIMEACCDKIECSTIPRGGALRGAATRSRPAAEAVSSDDSSDDESLANGEGVFDAEEQWGGPSKAPSGRSHYFDFAVPPGGCSWNSVKLTDTSAIDNILLALYVASEDGQWWSQVQRASKVESPFRAGLERLVASLAFYREKHFKEGKVVWVLGTLDAGRQFRGSAGVSEDVAVLRHLPGMSECQEHDICSSMECGTSPARTTKLQDFLNHVDVSAENLQESLSAFWETLQTPCSTCHREKVTITNALKHEPAFLLLTINCKSMDPRRLPRIVTLEKDYYVVQALIMETQSRNVAAVWRGSRCYIYDGSEKNVALRYQRIEKCSTLYIQTTAKVLVLTKLFQIHSA